jgi:hypothetical protein
LRDEYGFCPSNRAVYVRHPVMEATVESIANWLRERVTDHRAMLSEIADQLEAGDWRNAT